jgi:hypothetical protein
MPGLPAFLGRCFASGARGPRLLSAALIESGHDHPVDWTAGNWAALEAGSAATREITYPPAGRSAVPPTGKSRCSLIITRRPATYALLELHGARVAPLPG